MPDKTTETQGPSLEDASTAIAGLLSVKEEKKPAEKPPQKVPATDAKVEEDKSSSTAEDEATESTIEEEAAQAAAEAEAESEAQRTAEEAEQTPPRTYKVKVDGREVAVTEDELLKGYSRTEDYTQKTQRLANERKEWEAGEKAAVRAERQTYLQYLDRIKETIEQTTPKEPNWELRRMQIPAEELSAEILTWNKRQEQLKQVESERKATEEKMTKDNNEGYSRYLAEQSSRLQEAIPEFREPEKAKALQTELIEFGKTVGFTEDELRSVSDARAVIMLHNAMLHFKAQAKKPALKNKIDKALADSAPSNRAPSTPRSKRVATQERLAKSGSLDDGAAAIAELLDDMK